MHEDHNNIHNSLNTARTMYGSRLFNAGGFGTERAIKAVCGTSINRKSLDAAKEITASLLKEQFSAFILQHEHSEEDAPCTECAAAVSTLRDERARRRPQEAEAC